MNKNPQKHLKNIDHEPNSQVGLTAYDFFAPYYDYYMRHVDYDKWTNKIINLYAIHSSHKLEDILELACGTASISERLMKKGYKVTASDRSNEMLRYAAQKKYKPELLHADMTDEYPQNSVDLVILVFDSINYLIENKKIVQLFENVSKTLRKNGLFIFDISTHRNSVENFTEYINIDETEDYMLIHKADFDSENSLQKTMITIFKRKNKNYIRMDEEHLQRIYNVQELLTYSEDSLLECVGIYCLVYDKNLLKTNTRKLDHQYSRLFFVMKQR